MTFLNSVHQLENGETLPLESPPQTLIKYFTPEKFPSIIRMRLTRPGFPFFSLVLSILELFYWNFEVELSFHVTIFLFEREKTSKNFEMFGLLNSSSIL